MLAGKLHESHLVVRRRLLALGFAALIALAAATVPVLSDSLLDTSVVPSASACSSQSGSGDC